VKDPNQPNNWQDNPLMSQTLALNNAAGVYNTYINIYALHSCLENTDHYTVTALADWTPTNAHFQSAGTEDGSLYRDSNGTPAANWEDNGLDASVEYCGVPSFVAAGAPEHVCGFTNYPLSYRLTITPPSQGTINQLNAAPAATQGQASTYTSGFSFTIGGSVNVSANGPSGGLSAGAMWINTTATTVPPLLIDVGNTGNEGAFWNFQYCCGSPIIHPTARIDKQRDHGEQSDACRP
jgi:hypothetical protein